jgi:probable DNA metabolism protein
MPRPSCCSGRPLCRPAEHQHRAADRTRPRVAGAREGRRGHQALDGAAARAHRRREARRSARRRRPAWCRCAKPRRGVPAPQFAPAGQSTQMIVGADATDDAHHPLGQRAALWRLRLKRVYYSAFSPIPDAASALPLQAPPLVREHRLYQADWLMRFYGFAHDEIVPPPPAACCRWMSTPSWPGRWRTRALPGRPGPRTARDAAARARPRREGGRPPAARAARAPRARDDLKRLHVPTRKVLPFVELADTDLAGFRGRGAQRCWRTRCRPSEVHWLAEHDADADLFANPSEGATSRRSRSRQGGHALTCRARRSCAVRAWWCCTSEPSRFALLYRLLWRLVHEPALRNDPLDADMLQAPADGAGGAARHPQDEGFVRFRQVPDDEHPGEMLHVAWFEPAHHIVEANGAVVRAPLRQMRWAILTPERSCAGTASSCCSAPGGQARRRTAGRCGRALWLTYYQHIFNPARLKLR